MSEADATVEDLSEQPAERKGGVWKILLALIVLAALGAGAAWYLGLFDASARDGDAAAPLRPPIYVDVDSNMVVNFQGGGRLRYLQVGVQVMTRDPAAVEALMRHQPLLRNNLIMLFSEQSFETLNSREGKSDLQLAALAEVQAVLADGYRGPGAEAVYFTTFVMQ